MARKAAFDVKSYAIAVLRRGSYRTPMRHQALAFARLRRGQYRCAKCEEVFGRREIQVDHIKPVIPVTGWAGFDDYIARLYCPASGLQILCIACHRKKSTRENAQRRKKET